MWARGNWRGELEFWWDGGRLGMKWFQWPLCPLQNKARVSRVANICTRHIVVTRHLLSLCFHEQLGRLLDRIFRTVSTMYRDHFLRTLCQWRPNLRALMSLPVRGSWLKLYTAAGGDHFDLWFIAPHRFSRLLSQWPKITISWVFSPPSHYSSILKMPRPGS